MPGRTEIEKLVRWLVALDVISRPLSSLGDKGVRREDKTVKGIVKLIKAGEESGERVITKLERRTEQKARTVREGIKEFKKQYPQYGKILEGIITEKRVKRNQYLVYTLQRGSKLSEEDYIQVMMDLGFERREAAAIYPHIIAISERFGKADEQTERTILVAKG